MSNRHAYPLSALLLLAAACPLAAADRPWDPAAVTLESHELAAGVFAVLPDDVDERDHTATTAGIVVGERGVLVVESMINGRLASQLIAEVRKATALPIRFLVNTSYHGDHSYGNFAFPAQTAVIQHPATARYIESSFEADREFMLGLMGPGRGIEEVVPRNADLEVPQRLTIDLGGIRAELHHLGFAQTDGDLIVWLPGPQIAWVGNMIQAPPPALPWLLEGRHQETLQTLRRLTDFLPPGATIVPGHGRPMRPAAIRFAIDYLEELHRQVAAAIGRGLSQEETVAAVAMPEYRDYSLYPFAHRQVNVPAVYRDLQP